MKHSLGLKLSQGLSLTPALQQAIKLLQMSTLDLQQEIQDALDGNLMLEHEEADNVADEAPISTPAEDNSPAKTTSDEPVEAGERDDIPDEPPLDYEWGDVYGSGDIEADQALYDYRQANIHTATDLKTHLQDQATLESLSSQEMLAMDFLIDALDQRGFLPDWDNLVADIALATGVSADTIAELRQRMHGWDPIGVGALDVCDCLQLQLAALPTSPECRLAQLLIRDHLAELADTDKLRRALKCNEEDFHAALQLIRSLNPDPGSIFSRHEDEYVAPDVYVRKIEGHWLASINPNVTPKLRINDSYQELVKRADNSPDQQMMKQHLQEARYFLHSLKSRNETLLKVAQEIVDRQRSFLEYGPEAMRPLVLRDIAGVLGIHESTVSRATAHKYMHTPRGLFELKYFFSSAVSTAEGGSCSATAIQAMIRRLISEESVAKPLSDSQLTRILSDEGIQVARRTVAKYREGMDIPPSHERKRMA